jgi:hypothetical protein
MPRSPAARRFVLLLGLIASLAATRPDVLV